MPHDNFDFDLVSRKKEKRHWYDFASLPLNMWPQVWKKEQHAKICLSQTLNVRTAYIFPREIIKLWFLGASLWALAETETTKKHSEWYFPYYPMATWTWCSIYAKCKLECRKTCSTRMKILIKKTQLGSIGGKTWIGLASIKNRWYIFAVEKKK